MGQLNHEPSMEDILASIKRIIAEDSEAAGARTPRAKREAARAEPLRAVPEPEAAEVVEPDAEEADVLELTSPIEEAKAPEPADEDVEVDFEPEAEHEAAPVEAAHVEPEPATVQPVAAAPEPEPTPAPEPVAAQPIVSPVAAAEPAPKAEAKMDVLSGEAREASRNAFAALNQLQVRVETGADNTLEGLVADLLRPMLRDWLDRELPSLVERLVDAEISRISRRS